jgi:hypothetical protein
MSLPYKGGKGKIKCQYVLFAHQIIKLLYGILIIVCYNIYHLFTETEGNSVFCGPETTAVEGPQNILLSRGLSK